jgi:hypothetical protein
VFFQFQKSEDFIDYFIGLSSILIWVKFSDFFPTEFKKPVVFITLFFLSLSHIYLVLYAFFLIVLIFKKKIQRQPFIVQDMTIFLYYAVITFLLYSFKMLIHYLEHATDKEDTSTLFEFYSDSPPSRLETRLGIWSFIIFLYSLIMSYYFNKV